MLTKRIIPCLDVKDGRVVKGVKFQGLNDVNSPVELADYYSRSGADELVFYDITASAEGRKLFTDILTEVASKIFIPLTVGGGISTIEDFDRVLKCGADKVSVNSGVYRVFARGARDNTGMEAVSWIKSCVDNGAGEVVLNSIDTDGVKGGFDLDMLKAVTDAVDVPVIASGGAGCIQDFVDLFKTLPKVDAGLAASIFHFGEVAIPDLKKELAASEIPVRI